MQKDELIELANSCGDVSKDSRGRITIEFDDHALVQFATLIQQRHSMPPLNDAMRAVLRNDKGAYQSADSLYEALRNAANETAVVACSIDSCQCDMRTKMVGDGCKFCNPQRYIDILEEQIADMEEQQRQNEGREAVGEMRNDETTGHMYQPYWYDKGPVIGTKLYTEPPPSADHIPDAGKMVEGDGWMPIETAPRDGSRIIIGFDDGTSEQGFYLDNSKTEYPWQGFRLESMRPSPKGKPTFWQPLPKAPANDETYTIPEWLRKKQAPL